MREPLVHFLIAGALVFAFNTLRPAPVDPSDRSISITAPQVQRLTTSWMQTWQRPPTPIELDGIIRDYIKEEIYYREALRLGLDADDPVIRRRLRSKMEFLALAEIENATPDDKTLQAWLDDNPAKFATDPHFTFDQVYVAVTSRGADAAAAHARDLLQRLRSGADPKTLGDSISLPRSMNEASRSSVAREFGEEFSEALAGVKVGEWAGPAPSGFGLHLVRVRAASASERPTLNAVRQAVENDWRATTRQTREEQAYQALLDDYTIRIERPR